MARIAKMGLFILVAMACVIFSPSLTAGQLAPSPGPDCNSVLVQFFPCVPFLTNISVTTVTPSCCGALANVSTSSPVCLCEIISPANANATAQFNINETRALELPGMCSVNVSPASCSAILGGPSVAPVPALVPASAPKAKTPAPLSASTPAANCSAVTTDLLTCADFLTDSASSPSSTCCTNLGQVASASPSCLCQLASKGGSLAATVNSTRVTELPTFCKLSVSLSNCRNGGPAVPIGEGPGGSPNYAAPAAVSSFYMVISLCLLTLAHALLQ